MHSITIPVHSFVDVITNSSSEVFVTANKKSVETIKALLKLFLEAAGQAHEVDEVFDVKLVYDGYNDNDEECEMEGVSEYHPSRIKVSVKASHKGNYGELVKVINSLNKAFVGETFYN